MAPTTLPVTESGPAALLPAWVNASQRAGTAHRVRPDGEALGRVEFDAAQKGTVPDAIPLRLPDILPVHCTYFHIQQNSYIIAP